MAGRRSVTKPLAAAVGLAIAWVVVSQLHGGALDGKLLWLQQYVWNQLGSGLVREIVDCMFTAARHTLRAASVLTVAAATVALPLGYLARTFARGRARGGLVDPIASLRNAAIEHPRAAKLLLAMPAVASAWMFVTANPWSSGELLSNAQRILVWSSMSALGALGVYAATRVGFHALVGPTNDEASPNRAAIDGDIHFDAVAVTRETRAAVAAMVAVNAAALFAPLLPLQTDRGAVIAIALYAGLVLGGAALFKKASRIAVGVDGVLVKGTSRTRFFAYRELHDARANGADLELVRSDKVVLRLQLHGDDVARKDEILARVRSSIEKAREGARAAIAHAVAASSSEKLARAAQGEGEYRAPAVTREQLWELVEAPEADAAARLAAAEALASSSDATERVRLRIATEQVAEPNVRVALREMLDEEDDAESRLTRALRRGGFGGDR